MHPSRLHQAQRLGGISGRRMVGTALEVTESGVGGHAVGCWQAPGGVPPALGSSPGADAPRPALRGRAPGAGPAGRRADRPGQVQRPHVWGPPRPWSVPVSGRPVPRPSSPRRLPATLGSQVTEGGTPGRLRARPPRLGVHAHPAVPTLPAARGPPRGPLSGSWPRDGRARAERPAAVAPHAPAPGSCPAGGGCGAWAGARGLRRHGGCWSSRSSHFSLP